MSLLGNGVGSTIKLVRGAMLIFSPLCTTSNIARNCKLNLSTQIAVLPPTSLWRPSSKSLIDRQTTYFQSPHFTLRRTSGSHDNLLLG